MHSKPERVKEKKYRVTALLLLGYRPTCWMYRATFDMQTGLLQGAISWQSLLIEMQFLPMHIASVCGTMWFIRL